jgi:hypothetical protein
MYYVQDAHSFWDWIYFVALIIVSTTYTGIILADSVTCSSLAYTKSALRIELPAKMPKANDSGRDNRLLLSPTAQTIIVCETLEKE